MKQKKCTCMAYRSIIETPKYSCPCAGEDKSIHAYQDEGGGCPRPYMIDGGN